MALLLAVLSPLVLVAGRGRPGTARALSVAAVLLLVSRVCRNLPRVGVFAGLEWNWQGRLLDPAWVSILFSVLRNWARREAGLRLETEPGSLRRTLTFTAAAFTAAFVLVLFTSASDGTGHVSAERLLFDSAIPNLTEELIWRGAMLAVLDRALGTPWRFFGARVGWGLVLTSVGFGLGHGLAVEASGAAFDPGAVLLTGSAGLALGWVRAVTGSVWPAFVVHCAPNSACSRPSRSGAPCRCGPRPLLSPVSGPRLRCRCGRGRVRGRPGR
ncbi:CPBP family intramembrane metalloprotease [Thermobifida halotolerans]|uniref:CPBP family intramembrane metalloprotease n=1 Tax=Thermobifida halotolerans TaxID=483545 RepID=A0A399G4R7_9ACTN|nr:CPBP family intramembrane glutamic endopeptidase [Thermobifida halotolerans]UOE17840.1 CPBP family intramembrane metalloprotease [Thermobifida halotolerans]